MPTQPIDVDCRAFKNSLNLIIGIRSIIRIKLIEIKDKPALITTPPNASLSFAFAGELILKKLEAHKSAKGLGLSGSKRGCGFFWIQLYKVHCSKKMLESHPQTIFSTNKSYDSIKWLDIMTNHAI